MGVDWIRMRPTRGTPRAVLTRLVKEQAAAFAATDGGRYEGVLDHLPADPDPGAGAGSNELLRYVDLDDEPDHYRRVSLFTLNPIFPAEWRLAAYRSHLPEELPIRLQSWLSHLDQVRGGRHRDFLYAWYRYATTHESAQQWRVLRTRAATARGRTNNWAVQPALVRAREQILSVAPPEVSPVPYWGDSLPAITALDARTTSMLALARAWNSRVPAGQKVRFAPAADFDGFMESALDDPDLTDCLGWMRQAVADGYGLFLDW